MYSPRRETLRSDEENGVGITAQEESRSCHGRGRRSSLQGKTPERKPRLQGFENKTGQGCHGWLLGRSLHKTAWLRWVSGGYDANGSGQQLPRGAGESVIQASGGPG